MLEYISKCNLCHRKYPHEEGMPSEIIGVEFIKNKLIKCNKTDTNTHICLNCAQNIIEIHKNIKIL